MMFGCLLAGEFNEGVSAMLTIRGEGILSWIGDDNFVVEDKTSGTHEVFKSMTSLKQTGK